MPFDPIGSIHREIVDCRLCPRLRTYCERVAVERKRAYREEHYWGQPVPSFGDPNARLLIVGLAPAAHGANRTGRLFTGDASAAFLFKALERGGFSNLPASAHRQDGLKLIDAYLSSVVHCAPPGNKPRPGEIVNCRTYLIREIEALRQVRAVLTLGRIATAGFLNALRVSGRFDGKLSEVSFRHGASFALSPDLPRLFCSYHPSRQNTQTGRLTLRMLQRVLLDIRRFLDLQAPR